MVKSAFLSEASMPSTNSEQLKHASYFIGMNFWVTALTTSYEAMPPTSATRAGKFGIETSSSIYMILKIKENISSFSLYPVIDFSSKSSISITLESSAFKTA